MQSIKPRKQANTNVSLIAELDITIFVPGPTNNVKLQTTLLETIASDQCITPTHGGFDERIRTPFSVQMLATGAGTKMNDVNLWRITPPKYWGLIDSTPQPIARVLFRYESVEMEQFEPVGHAIERLVEKLRPEYAAMHFKWKEPTEEHRASIRGFATKAIEYSKYGPPGVFAYTWFGVRLVELFGESLLHEQDAVPNAWGGAFLRLVEQPWNVAFEQLRKRQIAVDKALRPKGIFGDYSQPVPKRGPQWIPLLNSSNRAR